MGLGTLKTILLTRTYLAGECLTHVDIADATVSFLSVLHTLDAPLCARYPNVLRCLDLT
ncbi:hypothetical protein F5141DRAFT_1290297, partial [Pisolithus sp. B1]